MNRTAPEATSKKLKTEMLTANWQQLGLED
jgi:hypothetical protein